MPDPNQMPEGIEDEYVDQQFAFQDEEAPAPEEEQVDDGYSSYDPMSDKDEPGLKSPLLDDEGNELPAFDEKHEDDFIGLAFVGALSKTFTWLGHRFVVRTLNVDELLAVARLTKPFDGTLGQGLAYRTAMVALAIETVDGEHLPLPYGVDRDEFSWSELRFNYVRTNWFQFTIDYAYNEYLELEERTAKVVDAMGKASAPTGSKSG